MIDPKLCYKYSVLPEFELGIEKKWESESMVRANRTPLSADMDNDCIPEILIGYSDKILVINPITNATLKEIETYSLSGASTNFVLVDINNDGILEIIIATGYSFENPIEVIRRLVCYDYDGNILWISSHRFDQSISASVSSAPAVTDFNHDGVPEVYIFNKIFNAVNGSLLIDGGQNGIGSGGSVKSVTVAAQINSETSNLELAAGYTVYDVNIVNLDSQIGNSMIAHNLNIEGILVDGKTSIGDLNNDGNLDVIVSAFGIDTFSFLYVYTFLNNELALLASAHPIGDEAPMGVACVSNLVSNEPQSIFVNRNLLLHKYIYNGTQVLEKLWSYSTTDRSGATAITTFDLNNDGEKEIILRDETSLKILNGVGSDVNLTLEISCAAPTGSENPIVADVDNSGQAKICVTCVDENGDDRLFLFGAPDSTKWAPARSIWNQYNYHVLNINDDGTVPQFMKNNATYQNGRYNNFMTQASLLDSLGNYQQKAMNVFGAIQCVNYDVENDEYTVTFDLENRDDASLTAPTNMEVSFYSDNPEVTNTYLGTYQTLLAIPAGEALLDLEYTFPASNLSSLYMVINSTTPGGGPLEDSLFTLIECDYSDNLVVTFSLPEIVQLDANICEGDTYDFYGTVLSDSGVYFENVKGSNGCDSVVTQLDLNITDTIMVSQSMETCDDYLWNDSTYTESGLYLFTTTSSLGCDSIVSLDLIINYSTDMMDVQTACDSFFWNDVVYTESDVYTYESITSTGCDSVNTLDLTILRSTDEEITHATCESYLWNGITYTESGIYTYETDNENGCDSTATLFLTINDTIAVTQSNSVCDFYTWNGNTYTESGSYPYATVSTLGCDSTITLVLEVLSSTSSEDIVTSCDSLIWNGTTYFDSGTYEFTTLNVVGCDSTATLDLAINSTSEEMVEEVRCDSYSWNGTVYTESGIYTYPTTNQMGCDSMAILDLEINLSDNSTTTIEACDSLVWNGDIYTESGMYDFVTTTASGCDSIATLELAINKKSETTVELSDCESITFNGGIIEENGTYTYDFQSAHGCDSIIILVASILSDKEQLEMTSCDTYRWDANGTTYDESGIYTSTFQNSHGCDSIIELELTIQKSQLIEEMVDVCGSFYWPIIEDTIIESGFYSETFLTQEGCDSIFELDIVVYPNYIISDTLIATNEYTWEANNTTYTESGVYRLIYPSENLCDSIHILNLTINKSTQIVFPNVISFNGINNGFTAYGSTIELIESISVFDKWGSLIARKKNLSPNDLNLGWDGTYKGQQVAQGVYVFSCTLLLKDGREITEYGDITVLR